MLTLGAPLLFFLLTLACGLGFTLGVVAIIVASVMTLSSQKSREEEKAACNLPIWERVKGHWEEIER